MLNAKSVFLFFFSSSHTLDTTSTDTMAGLKAYMKGLKSNEPVKNELEQYLEDPHEDGDIDCEFDILSWWRLKAPKYTVLAKVYRDVLDVPISTVPSESVFSTAGRILAPARSYLNNQSLLALICSQDWLRASKIGISATLNFFTNLVILTCEVVKYM